MGNSDGTLRCEAKDGEMKVSGHLFKTVDTIEQEIRKLRVERLWFDTYWELEAFPSVSFIRSLRASYVKDVAVQALSLAIEKMVVLESLDLGICDKSDRKEGENCLSNAIALHPSLKKVRLNSYRGYGIDTVISRNIGITDLHIGSKDHLSPRIEVALALATHIEAFTCTSDIIFRSVESLAQFFKNNQGLKRVRIVVTHSADAVAAIEYLNRPEELNINCQDRDELGVLMPAMHKLLDRCMMRYVALHSKNYIEQASSTSSTWSITNRNRHILHDDLPTWNFTGSRRLCDVDVHF